MNAETTMMTASGDVYMLSEKLQTNPAFADIRATGPFFECVARGTYFDYWANHQLQESKCLTLDEQPFGYFDIVHSHGSGKTASSYTIGVFIPRGANKKEIADHLREKFGAGTVLVEPVPMRSSDDNVKFLGRIRDRHRREDRNFLNSLITICAIDFAEKQPQLDSERDDIYRANQKELQRTRAAMQRGRERMKSTQ